jgi:chloride channel 3/4/5
MAGDEERANEQSRLLPHNKRLGSISVRRGSDAGSIISSHLSKDELALGGTAVGERLAYNDYTTIDWLHDLVSSKARTDRTLGATDTSTRSKTL